MIRLIDWAEGVGGVIETKKKSFIRKWEDSRTVGLFLRLKRTFLLPSHGDMVIAFADASRSAFTFSRYDTFNKHGYVQFFVQLKDSMIGVGAHRISGIIFQVSGDGLGNTICEINVRSVFKNMSTGTATSVNIDTGVNSVSTGKLVPTSHKEIVEYNIGYLRGEQEFNTRFKPWLRDMEITVRSNIVLLLSLTTVLVSIIAITIANN